MSEVWQLQIGLGNSTWITYGTDEAMHRAYEELKAAKLEPDEFARAKCVEIHGWHNTADRAERIVCVFALDDVQAVEVSKIC